MNGKTKENVGLSDIIDVGLSWRTAIQDGGALNYGKAIGKTLWIGVKRFTPIGRIGTAIIDISSGALDLLDDAYNFDWW